MQRRSFTFWMWLVLFVATGLGVGTTGCSPSNTQIRSTDNPAERRYLTGVARLENGDSDGAIDAFDSVRENYPYSRFATLAELRIADAYYKKEQYSSAAEQYRGFADLHPDHPELAYARFRAAKSVYEKMPSGWFFMPPPHQRDLSSAESAERELQRFVSRHGESEYADDARRLLREVRRRLADHEMYVAEFYLDRDNPRGAAGRLKYLLSNYSGLGLDAKALYLLAQSHLELGNVEQAEVALQDLIEYHRNTQYGERAQTYLDEHKLSDNKE